MWQPSSSNAKVILRGNTKQESTSKQVLEQAKQERLQRKRERDQPKAALKIQSVWRGRTARASARESLLSEWIQEYGALASQPNANISAEELAGKILPLALHVLLPPPGPQRAVLVAGGQLQHLNDACKTCLRGTMLFLLKFLTEIHAAASSKDPTTAAAAGETLFKNQHLIQRTALLCCASIGGEHVEPLMQTAAARILALFTILAMNQPEATHLVQLCIWLAPPLMLPLAASRLCEALSSVSSRDATETQRTAALGSVLTAQLNVIALEAEANSKIDHSRTVANLLDSIALKNFVVRVLAQYGLLQHCLSTPVLNRLIEPSMFCALEATAATEAAALPNFSLLRLLTTLTGLFVAPQKDGRVLSGNEACRDAFIHAIEVLLDALASKKSGGKNEDSNRHLAAMEAAIRLFGDGIVASKLQSSVSLPYFCQLYCSLLSLADSCQGGGAVLRLLSAVAFTSAGKDAFLPRLWRWLCNAVGLPLEIAAAATIFEVPSLPAGVHSVAFHAQQPFTVFCRACAHYLSAADDLEFYEDQEMFSLGQYRAVAAGLTAVIFKTHLPDSVLPPSSSAAGSGGAKGFFRFVKNTSSSPRGSSGSSPLVQTKKFDAPLGTSLFPNQQVDPKLKQQRAADLLQHAPRLLRALFDRDTRRQFCPPGLWLAPYYHVLASGGQKADVSGAAVLRALLQADQSAASDEDDKIGYAGKRRPPPGSSAAASSLQTAVSSSPATDLAALLMHAPQCIPFEERVEVFRGLVALDKEARRYNLPPIEGGPRPVKVVIRRSRLLEDALAALLPAGSAVRGPLSITFVNSQGMVEAGIDMGGLTKELLESVCAAIFQPNRGLFAQTSQGALFPHPLAHTLSEGPALFTLTGLILGKALYEGILLPAPLAPFFIARLQGRLPTLDDLAALDPAVHRGLVAVKRYSGDASDLGLDLTVETDAFGAKLVEELVPGGAAIEVSDANKLQYVHLMADWHLRRRLGPSTSAFGVGLNKILPIAWLKLFSAREVNQLLGGGEGCEIDVDDMMKHTNYSGGYSASSRTVQLFWSVVRKFSTEDKCALLRFATSTSRAPLGGFVHLSPPFTLHKVDCGTSPLAFLGGKDVDRLPTASTCANTLKLPNFKRESTLKEKLLMAIHSGAGFDLS